MFRQRVSGPHSLTHTLSNKHTHTHTHTHTQYFMFQDYMTAMFTLYMVRPCGPDPNQLIRVT